MYRNSDNDTYTTHTQAALLHLHKQHRWTFYLNSPLSDRNCVKIQYHRFVQRFT